VDLERSRFRLVLALFGESLREIAILLLVFVPLDAVMQQHTITPHRYALVIGGILLLFVAGIAMEVGARWIR
jgi:hypothetical protein